MITLGVCFPQPCLSAAAPAAGLLHQDHVWIPTYQFSCFQKNEFDEILCKLHSTEYTRSFEPTPTLQNQNLLHSFSLSLVISKTQVITWEETTDAGIEK